MNAEPDLDYDALCIDTNVFHETGYAFDKGLPAQLDQFAESPVQVVISEIVDREMKRHLTERIRDAREALEKALKKLQQELEFPAGNVSRARKAVQSSALDEEIAQRRLDDFYRRCDAIVVPADNATSREVLERYFKAEPPFEPSGDKKREFPDAYALVSIEKWAREKDVAVLVVSRDQGWKAFCDASEYLEHRFELGEALKLFQPHNAAGRLTTQLNERLLAGAEGDMVLETITEGIRDAMENMEIDVEADSHYYWDVSDVHAIYKHHEFRRIAGKNVDMDLVRVTEKDVTVRLSVTVACDVHANFELSMTDPIDKDQVGLGSQDHTVEEKFESDVLVTFEGDFAEGLEGVSVKAVEVLDTAPTVNFGEIEMDWQPDDDVEDDIAVDDNVDT